MITARDFVDRWGHSTLREQQAAQSHFNELCQLVGYKTPTQLDPEGTFFTFEEQVQKATGGKGRADVWYKGRFAWEYKGKHRDLDAAYNQLLAYKGDLDNPPLLVVCDFLEYRIYPQWTNSSGLPFVFKNEDLLLPEYQRYITWLLEDPTQFLRLRQSELEKREALTLQLAEKFAHLADLMRQQQTAGGGGWEPLRVARFLTKLVFALFAEDVGLMPMPFDQPVFRYLVEGARHAPGDFVEEMGRLFAAMDGQRDSFVMRPTPYFNGGLFRDSSEGANDGYEVLDLTQITGGIDLLGEVSEADWRFVNPTIFGTLFEGALDISKRAQLGAHYTGEADIRLVVEPVLMQPLYREWEAVLGEAEPLLQVYLSGETPKAQQAAYEQLVGLYEGMMGRLEGVTVLDPACGSGNFLYMSLRALKDLEARVRRTFEPLGLPFRDVVTPRQLYGIEKDAFAANLAKVVVWIGYLQWRYEDEGGVLHPYHARKQTQHPRQLPHPILKDKNHAGEAERIVCEDAILRYAGDGTAYEPDWPATDVIMGNPPFLGDKRMRGEMGSNYVTDLRALYEGRVPGGADLVTYWFEKARRQIEDGQAKRCGLLSTNSIRDGASNKVLKRIKDTGSIFMAWSDREWVLQGAAVRISIVGFDDGSEHEIILDGQVVETINPDLTTDADVTAAKPLKENENLCFLGVMKSGPFDIDSKTAHKMLNAPINSNGKSNREVIKPRINGKDITDRSKNGWVIDFVNMTEQEAMQFKLPFAYVRTHVKPVREQNSVESLRVNWWLHARPRPAMRNAFKGITRYIATPEVAKHRIFVWMKTDVIPDHTLHVIARDDDYFFGVLHSAIHELWSLSVGSWMGKGNDPRYSSSRTFDNFPFPWVPGKEAVEAAAYGAIREAAAALHAEREAWLNPAEGDYITLGITEQSLRERTLTNLYNAVEALRAGNGNGQTRIAAAAREFAPRLLALHEALDGAVLAAYGWDDLKGQLRTAAGEEAVLRRLLALNLERGG